MPQDGRQQQCQWFGAMDPTHDGQAVTSPPVRQEFPMAAPIGPYHGFHLAIKTSCSLTSRWSHMTSLV